MSQTIDELYPRPSMNFTNISEFMHSSSLSPQWIISNLLPIGLTLLSGSKHSGKTSLAMHLALDIATGTNPLNSRSSLLHEDEQPYRANVGHVYYLALDSSRPQLEEMTGRLLQTRSLEHPPRLEITNTFPPLTPKDGLLLLEAMLSTLPNVRLLVVDNLACLRKLFKGNDHELLDLLRRLTEQHQIGIMVLHSGKPSTPISAHFDHHLHISRLPIHNYYRLDTMYRNMRPASHLLYSPSETIDFRFATLQEVTALGALSAHKALTTERLVVLNLLRGCDTDLTPLQIATTLKLDYDCTRQLLFKMVKSSLLTITERGHYAIHPFIRCLLPTLLEYSPLMPQFTLDDIPPADTYTEDDSATAHNGHAPGDASPTHRHSPLSNKAPRHKALPSSYDSATAHNFLPGFIANNQAPHQHHTPPDQI
ncbi:AAA family ATPase [Ktedonospora formicarum]|uniref:Uncharacterized protein n=1 Tax=Ktedonospora formicarum TaxID=2778364 RepID=A0A8J3MP53_9CHLR|nr:AAA family ATPase [Ktedonospora formicarum]GHO43482.1 hypothetical protein KSX_16450 [Ktedonospora formicarum]